MNKSQYQKWLMKKGLHPFQIKAKKKQLGSPIEIPDYTTHNPVKLSNSIGNGTKSPDTSKAEFAKSNYALVPAYNKGPIMVVSKDNLKHAGKK